jgi:hypothetical protein
MGITLIESIFNYIIVRHSYNYALDTDLFERLYKILNP